MFTTKISGDNVFFKFVGVKFRLKKKSKKVRKSQKAPGGQKIGLRGFFNLLSTIACSLLTAFEIFSLADL